MVIFYVTIAYDLIENIHALKILFFALVRSYLEFASIICLPSWSFYIRWIEYVQDNFSKLLYYILNLPVTRNSYRFQIS